MAFSPGTLEGAILRRSRMQPTRIITHGRGGLPYAMVSKFPPTIASGPKMACNAKRLL